MDDLEQGQLPPFGEGLQIKMADSQQKCLECAWHGRSQSFRNP